MPVLDWTLSRRRKGTGGSTKVYKVDVISMTEDEAFSEMPTRSGHGTLRKIKSLNDLLEESADSDNESTKGELEQGEQQQEPELEEKQNKLETNSSKDWTNYLTQKSKKPVERMIVSGFSTLSRRAGGGIKLTPIIKPTRTQRHVHTYTHSDTGSTQITI